MVTADRTAVALWGCHVSGQADTRIYLTVTVHYCVSVVVGVLTGGRALVDKLWHAGPAWVVTWCVLPESLVESHVSRHLFPDQKWLIGARKAVVAKQAWF